MVLHAEHTGLHLSSLLQCLAPSHASLTMPHCPLQSDDARSNPHLQAPASIVPHPVSACLPVLACPPRALTRACRGSRPLPRCSSLLTRQQAPILGHQPSRGRTCQRCRHQPSRGIPPQGCRQATGPGGGVRAAAAGRHAWAGTRMCCPPHICCWATSWQCPWLLNIHSIPEMKGSR